MTECGLTNLAQCLPELFFQFILDMLNNALQPLLDWIHYLLTAPVDVSVMLPLWSVMVYVLSLFYGLFFMFAGFNLMVSGYDSSKREQAKEWLRNTVLMVLFIQASYFIYSIFVDLGSLLSTGMMNIIDPNFFLFTVDAWETFGLQLFLLTNYNIALVLTLILLGLRYLLVVFGVAMIPFAFFFYFVPPLKSFGRMILNVLLVAIFVTFFASVLLFTASALTGVFAEFGIILTTVAFLAVDLLMLGLLAFAVLRAVFKVKNVLMVGTLMASVKHLKGPK